MKVFILIALCFSSLVNAQEATCNHMETFDYSMQMCMPIAMKNMPMSMLMLQGNSFLAGLGETGPRSRDVVSLKIHHFG